MLIILLFVVCSVYCGFYLVVTNIFMPSDLDFAKSGINTTLTSENEVAIKNLENEATLMEKYPSLANTPQSQRISDAKMMQGSEKSETPENTQGNTEFRNFINYHFWMYILILRWDIANELKNMSNTLDKQSQLSQASDLINEKMATDWENGDDKAYAKDLRALANNLRQNNYLNKELITYNENLAKKIEN